MKLIDTYNLYFVKSGFIDPFSQYFQSEKLTFEQEKMMTKLTDRIAKTIDIVVQIHKLEGLDKNTNRSIDPHILINGLHCDLFTTLASIYLIGDKLFSLHSGNSLDPVKFWQNKYSLTDDDKKSLAKPLFNETFFIGNTLLDPKFSLRTYGEFGDRIDFQCHDLNVNNLLNVPMFATSSGIIQTKYYAVYSLLFLMRYLSAIGKYMGYDVFGQDEETEYFTYDIPVGMKIFHEIANEWMNRTS